MPENDEPDAVEQFMQDLANVGRDDALLDLLGQGYQVETPGDQTVTDMLGGWSRDITAEPATDVGDRALRGEHSPGSLLPTTTGGTVSSIEDRAQQLLALADKAPSADLQQLMSGIEAWNREVAALLGNSSGAAAINGAVQQALQTCGQLLQAVELMKQAAREAGQGHLGG